MCYSLRFAPATGGLRACLCGALLYACPVVQALEEIVVTATPLDDVLQPSTVLDEDALALKAAPSLGETLANELGVSSSYFGPAASRPVIRGLGGSRVTILSNAVSTLDVSDISPDHAVTIEPLLAERIEIVRGPTTLLYGSAAAGGVINVVDSRIPERAPDKPLGGALELRGDSAAEERTAVGRLDGRFGALAWHLDGTTRNTDDLVIRGFASDNRADRGANEVDGTLNNSASELDSYAAGASWIAARGYLGVALSEVSQRYGLPGPEAEEEEASEPGSPPLFDGPQLDLQQTRVDVRGAYEPESAWWDTLKIAYGTNAYQHSEIEASGEIATRFENDAWQARIEAVHAPLAAWRGALGLQYDARDFSAAGAEAFLAPTRSRGIGLFMVEERELDWGHVHLGVRVETLEHDNLQYATYRHTTASGALGLAADLPRDIELVLNVSHTARNPAAEELYADGAHLATRQFERGLLTSASGRAEVEQALNIEAGARRTLGAVAFEANVFYYDISNYVYQELSGGTREGLALAEYRQDDGDFVGFEGALNALLRDRGDTRSELRLFSDYVHARLDSGARLPRLPPWRLGMNLTHEAPHWRAGLDAVYHARQAEISSFATDAYTLVDLHARYVVRSERLSWEFTARASNLLNEDARKSTSVLAAFAPLPGRSLNLSVRARY